MKKNLWTLGLFVALVWVAACGGSQKEALWQRGPMHFDGNFDGVYQSDFGRLELTIESGDKVVGLYEKDDKYGRLEGEIKDNLLFFSWTQWDLGMKGKPRETSGKGVFQYKVEEYQASGGQKFRHYLDGYWGYGREKPSNPWKAYKLSDKAKKKLQPFDPNAGIGKVQDEDYEGASQFEDAQGGGGGGEGGGEGGGFSDEGDDSGGGSESQ
jgi:uncharacterized membrane protein YgcG